MKGEKEDSIFLILSERKRYKVLGNTDPVRKLSGQCGKRVLGRRAKATTPNQGQAPSGTEP